MSKLAIAKMLPQVLINFLSHILNTYITISLHTFCMLFIKAVNVSVTVGTV